MDRDRHGDSAGARGSSAGPGMRGSVGGTRLSSAGPRGRVSAGGALMQGHGDAAAGNLIDVGDDSSDDEGGGASAPATQEQVTKLERQVEAMQQQMLTMTRTEMVRCVSVGGLVVCHQLTCTVHFAHQPTPLSALGHSELVVGLWYPVLALITVLGWRMYPLSLATTLGFLWLVGAPWWMLASLGAFLAWVLYVAIFARYCIYSPPSCSPVTLSLQPPYSLPAPCSSAAFECTALLCRLFVTTRSRSGKASM